MSTQSKIIIATVAGVVAVFALPLVLLMAATLITTMGWQVSLIIMALAVIIPLIVWLSTMRNSLARGLGRCHEAWLDLDRELKRRHNLAADLVSTITGNAAHESDVLDRVTLARNAASASKGPPSSRARDENALVGALRQLLAAVDGYPDLQTNERLLKLRKEMANADNRVESALRIYNSRVLDYNNRVESGPSALVAKAFDFQHRELFHAEPAPEPRTPRAKLDHLPEKSTPPPAEESGPIPLGIVEPMPTESEPAVDTSARAVQEAPSLEVPQYPSEPRRFTRRTSPPAWPGWPSAFAGPGGPSS